MSHTPEIARPVSAAELRDLAEYLPENAASHLYALADRQAKAEAASPAAQALNFLALIEGLTEYDQVVASHLLIGLLRSTAGQKLLSVEKTALRIAGLAVVDENSFQMTSEGKALMEIISSQTLTAGIRMTAEDPDQAEDAAGADEDAAAFDARPFASLRFGQRLFEVADGKKHGSLIFRLAGETEWKALVSDRSTGWDEIGGEILEKGIDLLAEYVMMHTMRLAVPEQGEGVHHFELSPINWWIKVVDDTAFLRMQDSDAWLPVPQDIQEPTIRALGIRAAERMIPNFHGSLEPEALSWSRRMAHAASITPIMSSAA